MLKMGPVWILPQLIMLLSSVCGMLYGLSFKRMILIYILLCHSNIDNPGSSSLTSGGHNCPQCGSRYCELPIECKQCGLTLVSAPHLARSYHHLFPIKPFTELEVTSEITNCYSCAKSIGDTERNVSFLIVDKN